MNRLEKEQCISDVRGDLQGQSLVVVVKQSGVTVAESTQLRRNMRHEGAQFKVLKNTLLKIALKGTDLEGLSPFLTGPVALAFSADPVCAARVMVKFSEDSADKMQIVAGWLSGQVLNVSAVLALAKLPSLDELRAKILGLLMAPATKVVRTIKEPMARVARVVAAKK
ncbi:50S ribosomal protein L10 [Alphaproteobacteria bacterium]|nr:50S ribosomal protein L10 [Alphaproteobacteria bacterium]GHS95569.1 50S ribosomal protein L10 [Alphaproteobacteria bacterium]